MAKDTFINPATGNVETVQYDAAGNPVSTINKDFTGTEQGMQPLSGFAKQYNPSQLAQMVWQNPWSILPDVYKGIKSGGPGYQALRDYGPQLLTLYNVMVGGNNPLTGGTAVGDYTNWLNNMFKTLGTPGGRAFSSGELLQNIFKQKTGGTSALANILQSAGPSEQVNALFQILQDVAGVSMNPIAGRGYIDAARRAGDAYQNAMLRAPANKGANQQILTEWIAQHYPGLLPR